MQGVVITLGRAVAAYRPLHKQVSTTHGWVKRWRQKQELLGWHEMAAAPERQCQSPLRASLLLVDMCVVCMY